MSRAAGHTDRKFAGAALFDSQRHSQKENIHQPAAGGCSLCGTDVHNDTLANPHEIKVFGSRQIYFTEKI